PTTAVPISATIAIAAEIRSMGTPYKFNDVISRGCILTGKSSIGVLTDRAGRGKQKARGRKSQLKTSRCISPRNEGEPSVLARSGELNRVLIDLRDRDRSLHGDFHGKGGRKRCLEGFHH